MSVTVVLVRHGEKAQTGRANPGLTSQGVSQAANFEWSTDCVFLSPLRRALQTYALSVVSTRQVVLLPTLREHMVGISTYLEGEAHTSQEPREVFCARVRTAWDEIRKTVVRNNYRHVTIFSHEDCLFELQKVMGRGSPSQLAQGTFSVVDAPTVEVPGGP